MSENKVLVFGYGNPGRVDDGLGPALIANLEKQGLEGITLDSNYQLSIEDALDIAKHEHVIFVDASTDCKEPFDFYDLKPNKGITFSSHHVKAEHLLAITEELFKNSTKASMLSIRGYEFDEYAERLSKKAEENLRAATDFIVSFLSNDC